MSRRGAPPELFEIASLLLRYPEPDVLGRDPAAAAAAAGLQKRLRAPLERFLAHRRATSSIDLEREYVETFDTRRRCTLNVSYYLYGDTRRRGVALLRLKRMYAAAGLVLESDELPDHLPVMLGFAALAPDGYGEHVLQEHRVGIELLRFRSATTGGRMRTSWRLSRRPSTSRAVAEPGRPPARGRGAAGRAGRARAVRAARGHAARGAPVRAVQLLLWVALPYVGDRDLPRRPRLALPQ